MPASKNVLTATCACGQVAYEATGKPIVSVVCYCDDCQEAARRIATLRNAPPILDPDGGTAFIAYRKDRIRCTKGTALLVKHKLRESSPTNRVTAACCNAAMVLNFDDSKHWVSMYRARFQGDAAPPQMRICTKSKPGRGALPRDIPSYPGYPFRFIAKLIAARFAMMLGR